MRVSYLGCKTTLQLCIRDVEFLHIVHGLFRENNDYTRPRLRLQCLLSSWLVVPPNVLPGPSGWPGLTIIATSPIVRVGVVVLVRTFASRMKATVRASSTSAIEIRTQTVGRIGGDEGVSTLLHHESLAERVVRAFSIGRGYKGHVALIAHFIEQAQRQFS